MKPVNGAEFSTIIDINYGIALLASCVNIEIKLEPLLVVEIIEKWAPLFIRPKAKKAV